LDKRSASILNSLKQHKKYWTQESWDQYVFSERLELSSQKNQKDYHLKMQTQLPAIIQASPHATPQMSGTKPSLHPSLIHQRLSLDHPELP